MSWFRKAFNTAIDPKAYFAVVHPAEFHEWRYANIVPKGTIVMKHMPRSDTFTEGMVVASLYVPEDAIKSIGARFRTIKNIPCSAQVQVGQIQSPAEILHKFKELQKEYHREIDSFKQACAIRKYFISHNKEAHLYRVKECTSDAIEIENLGTLEEIDEKMNALKLALDDQATRRSGRAFEWADFMRFQNTSVYLSNSELPLDAGKVEFIVQKANLQPVNSRRISWQESFAELHPNGHLLSSELNKIGSLSWVQAAEKMA